MRGKEARFLRKSLAKGHKTKDPGKLGYKYLALYNFPLLTFICTPDKVAKFTFKKGFVWIRP